MFLIITIGAMINNKNFNLASTYYQKFLMQQNQLSSVMPNMNPSMFTGQSYQFGNQPLQYSMEGSGLLSNRMSIQPNEFLSSQFLGNQDDQLVKPIVSVSPLRPETFHEYQNVDNLLDSQKLSPLRPYDTANEQIPLRNPNELKNIANAKIEFENDQFNMNSTSKFVKGKQKDKQENFDDVPVGSGAPHASSKPHTNDLEENLLEIEVIRK